jgi:hypothetical protein
VQFRNVVATLETIFFHRWKLKEFDLVIDRRTLPKALRIYPLKGTEEVYCKVEKVLDMSFTACENVGNNTTALWWPLALLTMFLSEVVQLEVL